MSLEVEFFSVIFYRLLGKRRPLFTHLRSILLKSRKSKHRVSFFPDLVFFVVCSVRCERGAGEASWEILICGRCSYQVPGLDINVQMCSLEALSCLNCPLDEFQRQIIEPL